MKYSSVSPDSTQTDTDKQDVLDSLDFGKTKSEPCDSLLDFCKTKSRSCDNLDDLAELVSSQNDKFEFCKPNTADFEKFGTYREKPKETSSAKNSPYKPKVTLDGNRRPISSGYKFKRSRGHDSPVSTLEEVYLTLLHSERPKLYTILAFLSAIGLMN